MIFMKKFLAAFLAAWVLLALLSITQAHVSIPPIETLKIKNIDDVYRGGEYGAIELSRLEISEATDDEMAKYVGILSSCSLPKRAYGCVSPFGWNAYVSQDAVSSWKGSGLAAYALWS